MGTSKKNKTIGNNLQNITAYQIYYDDHSRSRVDPSFIPYDNSGKEGRNWMEFGVMVREYEKLEFENRPLAGFFSWKFSEKTGLSGHEALEFITINPGFDVYTFNPYPHLPDIHRNVWEQGELWHPDITDVTQKILDDLGYEIALKELENDRENTVFCNYWVATQPFWQAYMNFAKPVYKYIKTHEERSWLRILKRKSFSKSPADYRPYIMERLVSTFLGVSTRWRVKPYVYDENYVNELTKSYAAKLSKLSRSLSAELRELKKQKS